MTHRRAVVEPHDSLCQQVVAQERSDHEIVAEESAEEGPRQHGPCDRVGDRVLDARAEGEADPGALGLRPRDAARGVLSNDQKGAIRASLTELIEELEDHPDKSAKAEGGEEGLGHGRLS